MDELERIEYYEELMNEYQNQKEINFHKRLTGLLALLIGFFLCVLGSQLNIDLITYSSLIFIIISIVSTIACEIKSCELKKIKKELENIYFNLTI